VLLKLFISTSIFITFLLSLFYITHQNAVGLQETSKSISQNLEIAIDDDGYFYPNINDNEYDETHKDTVNDNLIENNNDPIIKNKKKNENNNNNNKENNNNQQQSSHFVKYKSNFLNNYINNNHYINKNEFIVHLDPYQVVSNERDNYPDSSGIVYLFFDSSFKELFFKVFLEGLSHLEGDDVEIIQINLGEYGKDGPTILSLCNEKKGKGHCREGPGLAVEGMLKEKDLKGPLKGSSFNELIQLFEYGQSYVYVQTRENSEGEIRGQISY
jgi:hypothetical protein